MTSLEENLVGRELINALDKSPEAAAGYQKTSFDYRPRFVLFYRKLKSDSKFSDLRQLI